MMSLFIVYFRDLDLAGHSSLLPVGLGPGPSGSAYLLAPAKQKGELDAPLSFISL